MDMNNNDDNNEFKVDLGDLNDVLICNKGNNNITMSEVNKITSLLHQQFKTELKISLMLLWIYIFDNPSALRIILLQKSIFNIITANIEDYIEKGTYDDIILNPVIVFGTELIIALNKEKLASKLKTVIKNEPKLLFAALNTIFKDINFNKPDNKINILGKTEFNKIMDYIKKNINMNNIKRKNKDDKLLLKNVKEYVQNKLKLDDSCINNEIISRMYDYIFILNENDSCMMIRLLNDE